MLTSCVAAGIIGCKKQADAIKRHNALREICPTDLRGLSSGSRQKAMSYITLWMKVLSTLGTSGISSEGKLAKVYTEELLPIVQPLEKGSAIDMATFKAGLKIYEALDYFADRLRNKKPFDNDELNALLRYEPGAETVPAKMSDGIAHLFFDYVQMVDEDSFRKTAAEARKHNGSYFQP